MVDGSPEVMRLSVVLHEHLVQVPLPLRDLAQVAGAANADLAGKHRTEPIDPEPHALMADVNSTLMKEVFYIAQRKRKSDVHHDRKLDDLGRRFEIAKWISGHEAILAASPYPLNRPVLLTMPVIQER